MLQTEDTMTWSEEPLALDTPSSLDGDALYSNMFHRLFSDEEAEYSIPVMPVICSFNKTSAKLN